MHSSHYSCHSVNDWSSCTTPRAGLLVGADKVPDAGFVTTAKYPFTNSTTPLGAVALTAPTENGHLQLVSTALDWLVITPEAKAVVKGRAHDYGFLGYLTADGFRGVVWPLSQVTTPPENPLYDTSAGASWDVDDTDLEPMRVGLTVIDSRWLPGLPPFPPLPFSTE